jgi:hypothetical protein
MVFMNASPVMHAKLVLLALQLPLSSVQERGATEVYKGVAAPKRKRVEDAPMVDEIPKVCFTF